MTDTYHNARTPVLLIGDPGIGKSTAVKQYAARKKLPCHVMVAAQEDPVDIAGVVSLDKDGVTSSRKVPKWWKSACEQPFVLLLDELTSCGPEQYAATLRATDDSREICGHELHKDTIVFAAMNMPESAAGSARELPPPVLSRFRHRHIGAQSSIDWMNGNDGIMLEFPLKAPVASMPRVVGAYLRNNPGAAIANAEGIRAAVERQQPFACPRAWYRAACEEGAIETWNEYVGDGAAGAFLNWFTKMDLPNPVDILAGRDKTVPKRGDACMATAAAIAGLLGEKPSEESLGYAMEWFRLAADGGGSANACIDLLTVCKKVGVNRVSRYGKELAPYGVLKKLAGQL